MMDAKYVFMDVQAGIFILRAAEAAISAGYEFMLFNEVIYYITPDGDAYRTKLRKCDIFKYM